MINKTLQKRITIEASPAAVWAALTKPEIIKEYFFGTETDSDWKEGSMLYWRGEWEGKKYEDKGVIKKLVPEKILQHTYWSSWMPYPDQPENYSIITYELEPAGKATALTLTQEGFHTEEAYEHSNVNWDQVLQGMKKQVEMQH